MDSGRGVEKSHFVKRPEDASLIRETAKQRHERHVIERIKKNKQTNKKTAYTVLGKMPAVGRCKLLPHACTVLFCSVLFRSILFYPILSYPVLFICFMVIRTLNIRFTL